MTNKNILLLMWSSIWGLLSRVDRKQPLCSCKGKVAYIRFPHTSPRSLDGIHIVNWVNRMLSIVLVYCCYLSINGQLIFENKELMESLFFKIILNTFTNTSCGAACVARGPPSYTIELMLLFYTFLLTLIRMKILENQYVVLYAQRIKNLWNTNCLKSY